MIFRACTLAAVAPLATLAIAPSAFAQFSISWSTIDGGGGRLSGGIYEVNTSIGQSDATGSAPHVGGNFALMGGFWPARVPTCLADFNNSGAVTVQDIFDFLNDWFAGFTSADFNNSGTVTVQDIFDFLNAWFAGCA